MPARETAGFRHRQAARCAALPPHPGGRRPLTPICAAPEQFTGGADHHGDRRLCARSAAVRALDRRSSVDRVRHAGFAGITDGIAASGTHGVAGLRSRARIAPLPARLIRGDLDAIVSKALRAEPAHRYATVKAHETRCRTRAARPSRRSARRRAPLCPQPHMLRRYRWAAAAAAAVFVSLAGGLGIAAWQAHRKPPSRPRYRASRCVTRGGRAV